ncbi:MAG: cell wall anchor protein [Muribaculaceae bacterium]|nr:cell wall anchor protein [Muribaculaceae bacterium]
MKNSSVIKSILATLLLSAGALTASAAGAKVQAMMDSTQLLMGRTMTIHLNIVEPADNNTGHFVLTKDSTLIPEIEIRSITTLDTTDIGNNLRQIRKEMVIQSFDSGDYIIPELRYALGKDTILSDKLALRVLPVNVDQMETINPNADVQDSGSRWWDFLPPFIVDYWEWMLLAIVVICGGIAAFIFLRKKDVKTMFRTPEPVLSPYEVAMRDLNILKEKNLWASGNEKEYYTDLTDILRIYLQNRFGINAMEMTTSQIVSELNRNEETRLPNRLMKQILEIADFVKFAKQRPLAEDNNRSFQYAVQFVEDTRPRVIADESTSTEGDAGKNEKNDKPLS